MPTADPYLRNVAIIAHVDHGKTTLVDALLAHAGTVGADHEACVLDSNPLERERGITILSKNCAIEFDHQEPDGSQARYRVNLIDTPGHADFGGEVERVLRMADGCLLLVDAREGPMPQTRFVLSKALALGLRPIVVVNKCDRPDARAEKVVDAVFDLLVALDAEDAALDFPVVYASGRDGWAALDPDAPDARTRGIMPILDAIIAHVPAPQGDPAAPLAMLITTIDWSEYVGRIAIGRVHGGVATPGRSVAICGEGGTVTRGRILKLHRFEGLGRRPVDRVSAGDLCAIEGLEDFDIGDTVADPEHPRALPRVSVDEPTVHMLFRINDSPFAGREGKYVTSRQLRTRLERELQSNVALRVEPGDSAEEFRVSGRGLLHLGVLLETLRRESYELSVGRPEVVVREIDGERCEPYETLTLDLAEGNVGAALELVGQRGGEILHMEPRGSRMFVECEIPARGLIGLRSRLLTATAGEAVMEHAFRRWAPPRNVSRDRIAGAMVAIETGVATTYSLLNLSERGTMFVRTGDPIYAGQVVGESARDADMPVNVVKAKAFSNVRESNKEATVALKAPRILSLEVALEYVEADELVEITPTAIRLRKRILSESDRKREDRRRRDREAATAAT